MGKYVHKIGILGGTFNPIHFGHLNLAAQALRTLKLERVIFVPAYLPPHKKIENNVTASDRINMVRAAIKNKKNFFASLYEVRNLRKSYSISTLRYFKKKFGTQSKLFFLTGTDSLNGIYTWKDIKSAFKLAQFVVGTRPGYPVKNCPKEIKKINMLVMDISSTTIRTLVKKGQSIEGLVPLAVEKYIRKKKLYTR